MQRLLSLLSGFSARLVLAVRSRRAFAGIVAAVIFGALALLALASSGVLWHDSGAASAATGGPEMVLNVKGGAVSCPQGEDPSHVCVPTGTSFTLSVEAVAIPAGGYILMQTYVDFGPDLVYKPAGAPNDEIVWPPCTLGGLREQAGPEVVNHACAIFFGNSMHVGNLVDLSRTLIVDQ